MSGWVDGLPEPRSLGTWKRGFVRRHIYYASPEIIEVEVSNRQSDSQTDGQTNYLTRCTGVCGFFLSVKFANSLIA